MLVAPAGDADHSRARNSRQLPGHRAGGSGRARYEHRLAVGERGALTMYGQPEQPAFDYRRT